MSKDGLLSQLAASIKGRCLFLLLSLLIIILALPSVKRGPLATHFVLLLHSLSLVAGVYAVADTRRRVITALSLAIPQVLFGIFTTALPAGHAAKQPAAVMEISLLTIFYFYAIICVLAYVSRGRQVSRDKIFGALSIYLMLGLAWASLYTLLELAAPGSFRFVSEYGPLDVARQVDLVYFSLVTLTTTGFGDITPLSDRARSLAALEAIAGVLYLAVLVSRLVNAYEPDKPHSDTR